jgi:hypothetical protein
VVELLTYVVELLTLPTVKLANDAHQHNWY